MKFKQKSLRTALLVPATLLALLGAGAASAQSLRDVRTPDSPLVLKARGSFYVGGEPVEKTAGSPSGRTSGSCAEIAFWNSTKRMSPLE